MKTYYIEVERQGWTLAVVKVEAETYEEAELKALKALHANDDLSEIDEDSVKERVANGEIDYVIDENGNEIECDETTCEDEEHEEEIDTSNLDVDEVIDWISEHEYLYSDFCDAFEYEYDEDSDEANYTPDLDEVVDWLNEQDEPVWEDFIHHFKLVDDDDYY